MGIIRSSGKLFDISVPVVVIGAGACGCSAALAANERGADVLMIERDEAPTGSTSLSGGQIPAAGTKLQKAAGIEDTFWLSCDRDGVPNLNGGISMSARDLARYGLIFARGGLGIHKEAVGSRSFIEATRAQTGPRYPAPADHITYGNQMRTNGRWIGHGGWGGQFLFIDPDSGTVVAFFSVLEDEDAADFSYQLETIAMAEAIALMDPV